MYSISLDEWNSVFEKTVKADKLDMTRQLHEKKAASRMYLKIQIGKRVAEFLD